MFWLVRSGLGLFYYPALPYRTLASEDAMPTDSPAFSEISDKDRLLSQLPHTLTTDELAELMRTTAYTVRQKLKSGDLPFRNVSLTPRKTIRFAAVDVVNWIVSGKKQSKRGRPAGSRNKASQNTTEA